MLKTISLTVPAPTFTVTADAYTSYDKYQNGEISAANNCGPIDIYDINCSVSISNTVLSQVGLSAWSASLVDSKGVDHLAQNNTFNGTVNENLSVFYKSDHISSFNVGAYKLSATATFDGVNISSAEDELFVTGLPYKAPSMVENDWKYEYPAAYSNGKIVLGDSKGIGGGIVVMTRAFYIPQNIGIKIDLYAYLRTKLAMNSEFRFFVNDEKVIGKKCGSVDDYITLGATSTFTPSGSSIKMESSYKVYGSITCDVYSLNILYNNNE